MFCFFKQKTEYEMRISDWSSDVCSSDLEPGKDQYLEPESQVAGFPARQRLHLINVMQDRRIDLAPEQDDERINDRIKCGEPPTPLQHYPKKKARREQR